MIDIEKNPNVIESLLNIFIINHYFFSDLKSKIIDNYIYIPDILEFLLQNKNFVTLINRLKNPTDTYLTIYIYYLLLNICINLCKLNTFFKYLKSKIDDINKYYTELLKKEQKVFFYLKVRNDAYSRQDDDTDVSLSSRLHKIQYNNDPRYKVSIPDVNDKNLLLIYKDCINSLLPYLFDISNTYTFEEPLNDPWFELAQHGEVYFGYNDTKPIIKFKLNDKNLQLKFLESFKWDNGKYLTDNYNYRLNQANSGEMKKMIFGLFEKIYTPKMNNRDFDSDKDGIIDKMLEKIIDYKDVFIFGNGVSGAGKTSLLLKYKDDYGILYYLLKKIGEKIDLGKAINISFKVYEYYNNNFLDSIEIDIPNLTRSFPLRTFNDALLNNVMTIILQIMNQRKTFSTINNPDSSRSHLIFHIKLERDQIKPSNIFFCDFAGIENNFLCNQQELDKLQYLKILEQSKQTNDASLKLAEIEIPEIRIPNSVPFSNTNEIINNLDRVINDKIIEIIYYIVSFIYKNKKNKEENDIISIEDKKLYIKKQFKFPIDQNTNINNFIDKLLKKMIANFINSQDKHQKFNELFKFSTLLSKYKKLQVPNQQLQSTLTHESKDYITNFLQFLDAFLNYKINILNKIQKLDKKENYSLDYIQTEEDKQTEENKQTEEDKQTEENKQTEEDKQTEEKIFKDTLNDNDFEVYKLYLKIHIIMKNYYSEVSTSKIILNETYKTNESADPNSLSNKTYNIATLMDKLFEIIKELFKYKKLNISCENRNIEGISIRNSLKSTNDRIKEIISSHLCDRNIYCRNLDLSYLKTEEKKLKQDSESIQDITEESRIDNDFINTLFKKCEIKTANANEINFFILTIINITDSIEHNNPSAIPFIDTSEVHYSLKLYEDTKTFKLPNNIEYFKELYDKLLKLLNKIINYHYYMKNNQIKLTDSNQTIWTYENFIESLNILLNKENYDLINVILNIIDTNNKSTLIGSLNLINEIQTNNLCIYSIEKNYSHSFYNYSYDFFKEQELSQTETFNKITSLLLTEFEKNAKKVPTLNLKLLEQGQEQTLEQTLRQTPGQTQGQTQGQTPRQPQGQKPKQFLPVLRRPQTAQEKYMKYKIKYYKLKNKIKENII